MKACLLLVILLLVIPMAVLNPLGRPAFLGYYTGVVAAWAAYVAHYPILKAGSQSWRRQSISAR